jgi:hypothetical protein
LCLFEDCEFNVLCLKSSFKSSLLDWAVTLVTNFSSSSCSLFRLQMPLRRLFSLVYFLCMGALPNFFNKLLFLKESYQKEEASV